MPDSFDAIYADVPPEQAQRLRAFRESHPAKAINMNGVTWEYLASGQGQQAILLLVGGLRVADAAFRSIPMLEGDFRVVTPTYPPVRTMAQLCDGLVGILNAEGIVQAHVLAGSFGGMVAQCLLQRHPSKVAKLILSTTTTLDEHSVARYRQQVETLSPLPAEMVRAGAKEMLLGMVAPPPDELAFWKAYIDELFTHRLDKDDLLSTLYCIIDFAEHYPLRPGSFDGWQGEMLILESDDDTTFDAKARQAVRGLFPQAKTYTFHNAGHSPATSKREEYFSVVKEFLNN
jgi:pimeloyl-ACP methyl ester carboxylesterase